VTTDFSFIATNLAWTLPALLAWIGVALAGGYVLRGRFAVASVFVGGVVLQIVTLVADFATSTALTVIGITSFSGFDHDVIGLLYGAKYIVQGLLSAVAWAVLLVGVFLGRTSTAN
jgi:hypothetical protein